jgi:hypothetical protein
MDSKQHIELVLNQRLRPIFEKAAAKIDSLRPGEKVPATELAKELGKEIGMTGPQLYPTLLFLFKDFPGIEIKRGAHGGLCKLPTTKTVVDTATPDVKVDVTNSEETLSE